MNNLTATLSDARLRALEISLASAGTELEQLALCGVKLELAARRVKCLTAEEMPMRVRDSDDAVARMEKEVDDAEDKAEQEKENARAERYAEVEVLEKENRAHLARIAELEAERAKSAVTA